MSLRNLQPLTFKSSGLSDSLDGTNAFPGAMQALVNLVQWPGGEGSYVCRAASDLLSNFPLTPSPGLISALEVVGTRAYGMIASANFAGHDVPFCYDLNTNAFVTIGGITSGNTPVSPPAVGDWIPPCIVAITATIIIVTHPGFPGGAGAYFGWFDLTTPASPQWNAGNTTAHPLPSVPLAVAGFNGRAYYACANSVVFSDSLVPLNVTNASQALILGDNEPVTALSGLPLTSQVTGGTIQALIAFKGAQPFFQITGDAALQNLTQSLVNGSVGTLAPNTICATPLGLAFIAPDGLRILSLSGTVTDPIGAFGKGVCIPFINAVYPSRMCAAYNQDFLRISVQNGYASGAPQQEYWLNMTSKVWTGPHTFPAGLIEPYTGSTKVGFVLAPVAPTGQLYFHTAIPQLDSGYEENGQPLAWNWQTTLLPDNTQMTMNSMVETAVAMVLGQSQVVNFTMTNELAAVLNSVSIKGSAGTGGPPVWGTATWGQFVWGGVLGFLQQYRLPWTTQIVFKQASLHASGASQNNFAIGNAYLGYQPLNYLLEDWVLPPPNPFILDVSTLDGGNVI